MLNYKRQNLLLWAICFITLLVMSLSTIQDGYGLVFWLTTSIVHSAIYIVPALAFTWIARLLETRIGASGFVLSLLHNVLCFLTLCLLIANYKLESMYGFFIDAFVINLVLTPGGIEALGASTSFYTSLAQYFLVGFVLYQIALRFLPLEKILPTKNRKSLVLTVLATALIVQSSVYATGNFKSDMQIVSIAKKIPLYQRVTAKDFLIALGIDRPRIQKDIASRSSKGQFTYPPAGVKALEFERKYNIVWLVAESWRWDMLTPEIMPNTYEFAGTAQHFKQHYSTGNGTRMGMFGQFYGMHGRYWFEALLGQFSPLLIDSIQKNGYDFRAFTSATFTYPEFDKTIFLNIENKDLVSQKEGAGWERDRANVDQMLSYIEQEKDPFFTFLFFESAHANYYFPEDTIIRKDYLDDFDYLTTDIASEISGIKNRYINSSNHLDQQFARVISTLKEKDLLKDTIVVITGDHGEEFMENGRWGHNSTFSQQQIRVPLILHIPGASPAVTEQITSHLDLPATVLTALSGPHDSQLYSHGSDLIAPDYSRDFAVVSDWHGDAIVSEESKFVFSSTGWADESGHTSKDDKPLPDANIDSTEQSLINDYVKDSIRFYRRGTSVATGG